MAAASEKGRAEQKSRSLFDLPPDFFDSCRFLRSHPSEILPGIQPTPPLPPPPPPSESGVASAGEGETGEQELDRKGAADGRGKEAVALPRWTCHTCKAEFESLQDQRSHFKSDVHRLNVKLSIAGKNTVKEEDFYELGGDSLFEDIDVSSISGSEDESEKGSIPNMSIAGKARQGVKQKLYFRLHSGDTVSIWRCLILDESEEILLENNELNHMSNNEITSRVEEGELISKLKNLVHEPRDRTQLRIVLLASGGHFAGCVFDGNSIIAHKTFHRYVVRAKSGKKQSSQDAGGKAANSAGSSLRRYNEAALKKEIQELLVTWKPYIDSSLCIFIYAPSKNRQMLFNGERPQGCVIRHVPLTVHRPTLKEAKRVYNHLTDIAYEVYEKASLEEDPPLYVGNERKSNNLSNEAPLDEQMGVEESSSESGSGAESLPTKSENIISPSNENEVTPLHEAAESGDVQRTLELLEQGLNPCIKDSRGRTPYMLATEKEVRNSFRRFMALNLDKWDWHAANVPSPLTKEMEESQAAKQAEKDAKRKAKAKELKKLRKAKEKAKTQAATSQIASTAAPHGQQAVPASIIKQQPQFGGVTISKEEEQRRSLAAEREKRAAAAERRIAAVNLRPTSTTEAAAAAAAAPPPLVTAPASSQLKSGANDVLCSCCNASLAGKTPFHRYNYKYCSTSCMYVHKEMLEDG